MDVATGKPVWPGPELPSLDLSAKRAFIVGSARGIGRAVALALAGAGADVAINCHDCWEAADEVCDAIRRMGRKAHWYASKLLLDFQVEETCAQVRRDLGAVDILVNNVGNGGNRPAERPAAEAWDEVLASDLTRVYLVTKQFIDAMAERGWGRVINMPSLAAEVNSLGQAGYAAARAGMIGLTKTLARQYARQGITVNAVAPGFTRTPLVEGIAEGTLQQILSRTPIGRLGEPVEIAAGVLYLASPSAGFVTGAVLDIDGGYAM